MPDEEQCRLIILEQRAIRNDFEEHVKDQKFNYESYIAVQNMNTKALQELASHTKEMRQVLEVATAVQGAIKVGGVMGTFMAWLFKFSFIGAFLIYLAKGLGKIDF